MHDECTTTTLTTDYHGLCFVDRRTYEQLQAGGKGISAVAPAASFFTQGADELAGTHQPLLTQAILLLQGGQLCLGV